jgi:hypothetical protein
MACALSIGWIGSAPQFLLRVEKGPKSFAAQRTGTMPMSQTVLAALPHTVLTSDVPPEGGWRRNRV